MCIPKEILRITCFNQKYLGISNTYLESHPSLPDWHPAQRTPWERLSPDLQCSVVSVLAWRRSGAETLQFTTLRFKSKVAPSELCGHGQREWDSNGIQLASFLWCGPSCPHHCSSKWGKKCVQKYRKIQKKLISSNGFSFCPAGGGNTAVPFQTHPPSPVI